MQLCKSAEINGHQHHAFLSPANLQLVLNGLNAIDTANDLLGHLLLVERADGAFEADVAADGLDLHLAGREVVVVAESATNGIEQSRIERGCGGESGFHHKGSFPLGVGREGMLQEGGHSAGKLRDLLPF